MNEYDFLVKQNEEILNNKLDKATKRALKIFEDWNNVTGCFQKDTGYYFEIQGCIEDAVKCGMQSLSHYEKLDSEKSYEEF